MTARILIVEDEALIALMLEGMVKDAGYEVFGVAASLASAGALLANGMPDAAFLDLRLGGDLSYPIALALKERGIRFAFMTGYEQQSIDTAFAPISILRKPVSAASVSLALRDLVGGA